MRARPLVLRRQLRERRAFSNDGDRNGVRPERNAPLFGVNVYRARVGSRPLNAGVQCDPVRQSVGRRDRIHR